MGGELGKSLVRTAARSSRATAIEGLDAETSRVVSSARQLQSHLTPFPSDPQASGRAIHLHRRQAVGPPRSGFVQEACTRKATMACGEAIVCAGPSGTGFFLFRTEGGKPVWNHSGAATVVRHRSTGTRCSGAVSRGGLGERLELILPGSGLLKSNGCPIWLHYSGGNRGKCRS
jgi:hypothetical protein